MALPLAEVKAVLEQRWTNGNYVALSKDDTLAVPWGDR